MANEQGKVTVGLTPHGLVILAVEGSDGLSSAVTLTAEQAHETALALRHGVELARKHHRPYQIVPNANGQPGGVVRPANPSLADPSGLLVLPRRG